MKSYIFRAKGGARVIVADEGLSFSPVVRDLTFRRLNWPRADIAAVSVQPLPRRRCEVAVTHRDGSMRRFSDVHAAAAEVESAFAVRGYAPRGAR